MECRNALSKLSYLNGIKELDRGALPWTRYPEERDVLIIEVGAHSQWQPGSRLPGVDCWHRAARARDAALGGGGPGGPGSGAASLPRWRPACAPVASLLVLVPTCPAPACLLLLQGVVDTPVVPDY